VIIVREGFSGMRRGDFADSIGISAKVIYNYCSGADQNRPDVPAGSPPDGANYPSEQTCFSRPDRFYKYSIPVYQPASARTITRCGSAQPYGHNMDNLRMIYRLHC
jgi:hypothetical protein